MYIKRGGKKNVAIIYEFLRAGLVGPSCADCAGCPGAVGQEGQSGAAPRAVRGAQMRAWPWGWLAVKVRCCRS